jgi:hypothetical protein
MDQKPDLLVSFLSGINLFHSLKVPVAKTNFASG